MLEDAHVGAEEEWLQRARRTIACQGEEKEGVRENERCRYSGAALSDLGTSGPVPPSLQGVISRRCD